MLHQFPFVNIDIARMKSIAVYTSFTSGYDAPTAANPLWSTAADFIAFTDGEVEPGWDRRPICNLFHDPCRNAKRHKILPHEYLHNFEYSVWVDGSVMITSAVPLPVVIAEVLAHHDIAVFRHRRRWCIYQEALACIRAKKDDPAVIEAQMKKYRSERYPAGAGLAECTVIFRRHTAAIKAFNLRWHEEIQLHSRRDQLSFNYVVAQHKIGYSELPGTLTQNDHFVWGKHLTKKDSDDAS
jgi:hypothetical protein